MGHWNHRVVSREYSYGYESETLFSIHEVYYRDDGSIWAATENPTAPIGHNLDDLKVTLERMLKCLEKPVVDWDEIPGPEEG